MQEEEVLVEDMFKELQNALELVDDIVEQVQRGELDTYEGFMQTQEARDKATSIAKKLQDMGLNIDKI